MVRGVIVCIDGPGAPRCAKDCFAATVIAVLIPRGQGIAVRTPFSLIHLDVARNQQAFFLLKDSWMDDVRCNFIN